MRPKAPIAQNPADGVLLFNGRKWLDEIENCYQLIDNLGGWMLDARYVVSDYEIRPVQERLGQKDVRTTMIYTHVLNRADKQIKGFEDDLQKEE